MKTKLFFVIILFCITSLSRPNPIIVTPTVRFSELFFDKDNQWSLELVIQFPYYYKYVDSVIIRTPDVSRRINLKVQDTTFFYVIKSDSLETPLTIAPGNVNIHIQTYSNSKFSHKIYDDSISSKILSFYPGYSLCKATMNKYKDLVYISKTHTLGGPNDLISLGEKMTGHIYDKDNKPVEKYFTMSNGNKFYFEIHEPITINQDGTYATTIYPETYFLNQVTLSDLTVRIVDFEGYIKYQDIEPLKFSYIHPDTVIVRDIHLKSNDYVVTNVEKQELPENTELTLINYPNPFNSSTNFFVKLPDDIKENSGDINIYNTAGRLIRVVSVKNGSTAYWDGKDLDGNIMASGIYYYQLNIRNKVLKSGSMILLK